MDSISGYWAESLPVIESPLCAVIDTVRDFRWHAYRCGGPETAAFLCEMEVPEWASECTIRALPALTIQYMSDSATVELTRDCGEEGVKQMTCRGKQDRDMILSEMLCSDEIESLNADNLIKSTTLTESHQNTAELIKTMPSDNNEENTVESQMNKIETSAEKVVDKFNIDDMMLGDQPFADEDAVSTPEAKPTKTSKKNVKPLKKTGKQVKNIDKETTEINKEEIMMGDQPVENLPTTAAGVTTEEILPHQKKSLPKDLKRPDKDFAINNPAVGNAKLVAVRHKEHGDILDDPKVDSRNRRETVKPGAVTVTSTMDPNAGIGKTSATPTTTTAPLLSSSTTPTPTKTTTTTVSAPSSTSATITTTTTTEPSIKITKKSFNSARKPDNEDVHLAHAKDIREESVLSHEHFIPPMLMVRSQTPPNKGHSESENNSKPLEIQPTKIISTETHPDSMIQAVSERSISSYPEILTTSASGVEANLPARNKSLPLKIVPPTLTSTQSPTSASSIAVESTTLPTLVSTTAAIGISTKSVSYVPTATSTSTTTVLPEKVTITSSTALPGDQQKHSFHRPHAPKNSAESPAHPVVLQQQPTSTINPTAVHNPDVSTPAAALSPIVSSTSGQSTATNSSDTPQNVPKVESTAISQKTGGIKSESLTQAISDDINSEQTNDDLLLNHPKRSSKSVGQPKHKGDKHVDTKHADTAHSDASLHEHHADFTNAEDFQRYKPNRRRVLTKPETHTYIQKIFG